MRLKLTVLAAATCLIFTIAWAIGLNARNVATGWTPLHVVRLPRVPRHLYPGLHALFFMPLGVESSGDVIVSAFGSLGGQLVRYDPKTHRWLRGEIGSGSGTITMSPRGGIWLVNSIGGDFPVASVTWMNVNTKTRRVLNLRLRYGRPSYIWQPHLAIDQQGAAWMVGTRLVCPDKGRCFDNRPVLGHIPEGATRVQSIPVPAGDGLDAVAAGSNGDIWMVDAPHCSGIRCPDARIIRYDPRTRAFGSYVLPGRSWKKGRAAQTPEGGGAHLQVAPDGTVWVEPNFEFGNWTRTNIAAFNGGRFKEYKNFAGPAIPMVDEHDNLWLQNNGSGSPVVFDPKTGSKTLISEPPGGTLLQDQHGGMWWVEGP